MPIRDEEARAGRNPSLLLFAYTPDFDVTDDVDPQLLADYKKLFTSPAQQELKRSLVTHAENLLRFSFASQKSDDTEVVLKNHVVQAKGILAPSGYRHRWQDFVRAFGGILMGAGLSALFSMLHSESFPPWEVASAVGLCTGGGILMVCDLPQRLFQRKQAPGHQSATVHHPQIVDPGSASSRG